MRDQLRRRSLSVPASRSVLLTILGEFVMPLRAPVWQETLVAALESAGYKTQAARQALSRSIAAGWLRTERHGRRARLFLADESAEMLRAGAKRIYSFGDPWEWDGRWLLVVVRVPEDRREVRHHVRTRLAWAGFGSLGGGLWISPHVEREDEVAAAAGADTAAELLSFDASLRSVGDPVRLMSEAWDLDAVGTAYREFIDRFRRLRPRTPEAVFRAQIELVHEWRKFPFLDPDLPEDMLPARWPRRRALTIFRAHHETWRPLARNYFASLEALRAAA